MSISTKTLASVSRNYVRDIDGLYPDRSATPSADGTFSKKDTGSNWRISPDDVPTTTDDMSAMFTWEHGDEVYGTDAKEHEGMARYRSDINRDYGQQDNKKDVYLNTFKRISDEYARVLDR